MKNTKKQLFTAVAMLLVATVALGTATYAWFVNNAAVEVDNMNFTASSSMALDIGVNKTAAGAVGPDGTVTASGVTYGTLVSLADITGIPGYTSFSAISLHPASADNEALKGGKFFKDLAWNTTNSAVSTYEAVTMGGVGIGPGVVKMIPLWFRSSQNMNVWLASGSAVTASAGNAIDKPGVDSDLIDKALRVSFVQPNGDFTTYAFPGADREVTGKRFNYQAAGGTAGQGVHDTTPSFAAQTLVTSGGFTYVKNSGNVWDENYDSETNALSKVVTTEAGKDTLVKVYIWLEGCDEDCVTAVSGGKVDVKLNFIGQTVVMP